MKRTGPMQRLLSLALALAVLMSFTVISVSAEESGVSYDAETGILSGVSEYEAVEDALLYTIDEEYTLIYDVTYTTEVSAAVVIDTTGQEIDTIDVLAEELNALDDAFTADLYLDADGSAAVILLTACEARPVIGISWKSDTQDYSTFIEELYRNGAIAVELPQIYDAESARAALAEVDGIMVTGGEDVDPALYGEEAYPHGSSGINEVRDTSDINLIQQAIAMDVPMLAICRGEQIFNVAMGGALIQDIPTYLASLVESGEIDESRVTTVLEDSGYWDGSEMVECEEAHYRVWVDGLVHSSGTGYHEISDISADSKWLYDIVGDTTYEVAATAHHQAVDPDRLGEGLTIVAYSSDGIVEAIEYQDNLFALGIQFHPERDALEDTRGVDVDQDLCNRFLRTLVEYGSIYAESKAEEAEEAEAVTFTDDGESDTWLWASDYIYACAEAGILSGYEDGSFLPDGSLTRAEAAKIIAEALDLSSDAETSSFSDITDHWALTYIEACAEAGILSGYPDGSFCPDETVSRAEFAKMLAGAVGTETESDAALVSSFTDVPDGYWALAEIELCLEEGIITGYEDGTFLPAGSVTRAEAAAMIARALELAA